MGFYARGVLGLALMLAGIAGFAFGLYQLTRIGTCASGGPFVSARPCPSSVGWYVGAIIAGVVGFIAGGVLFASRGRRATQPGLPPRGPISKNPPSFGDYRRR
jgi:hypothetical protein